MDFWFTLKSLQVGIWKRSTQVIFNQFECIEFKISLMTILSYFFYFTKIILWSILAEKEL